MNYATRKSRNPHDRLCSEPGCKAKHHAQDYCQTHYRRIRRAGDLYPQQHMRVTVPGWGWRV